MNPEKQSIARTESEYKVQNVKKSIEILGKIIEIFPAYSMAFRKEDEENFVEMTKNNPGLLDMYGENPKNPKIDDNIVEEIVKKLRQIRTVH